MDHHRLYKTNLRGRTLWYDGTSSITEEALIRRIELSQSTKNISVEHLSQALKDLNLMLLDEDKIKVKTECLPISTDWNIPKEYKIINIPKYVFGLVERYSSNESLTDVQIQTAIERVSKELELFKKYNLSHLLRVLIFIINTLQNNNVVWGVGRGSCVSSFVLFLIGIHDVDSLKYSLDIEDFLHD